MDVKTEGDLLYILGETRDELGASEYADELHLKGLTNVPQVEFNSASQRYKLIYRHTCMGSLIRRT